MRNMEITTSRLAEICGVSQGTVDRALNGRGEINLETKQKILRAAKQYGYRKPAERSESDKIKGQIGIVVFNLNNEYFSDFITETEQILSELGYCAVVMTTQYDMQKEIECIKNLYNMGVCGIILCSSGFGKDFKNYLALFDIPIVAIGNDLGFIPYAGVDNFSAMREMTLSVLKEGYSNLVYFSPALKYKNAAAQILRYKGFLSAADGKNFKIASDISEVCETCGKDTAVICSADYYALLVYFKTKCKKITGFDNISAIKKYNLKIDSVDSSVKETAKAAVDIIMNKKETSVVIPHRIVKYGKPKICTP